MQYEIALLPGDGIGPEVVDATVPLLEDLGAKHGFEIVTTRYDWGSERYLREGSMLPDDAPEQLQKHDAIMHGAMGHPDVPDHISSRNGHISIRKALDHYVNLRPVYLFEGVQSALRAYDGGEIDIAWYRENTEGEYLDVGGRLERGGETEMAVQTSIFTRRGIDRIVRDAFEAALERDGKVTNVTKSNALPYGPVFWDEIVAEVAEDYPEVTVEHLYVDAANMDLVRRPHEFDVVVSTNLFGDILTDLTAAITGGLGLAPSANLNPSGDVPGMFEPVHGSAPDIVGQGIANPLATVLSASLMLDDVGEPEAAQRLHDLVAAQLAEDGAPRTPDLGGEGTTTDVVEDLRRRI